MTVNEAIGTFQRVGAVEVSGCNLRLKFPVSMRAALQPAIHTLRNGKAQALARLSQADPAELVRASAVPNEADAEFARGMPWTQWKAATLNRRFQEQGATGQPGRITAATVTDGEEKPRSRMFDLDARRRVTHRPR